MTRLFKFAPDEFYHLYNRGSDKQKIFFNKYEYERFLCLMYLCNQEKPVNMELQPRSFSRIVPHNQQPLIDIGAYCLMPNHFHIIAKEKTDGGISKFMQKLTTAYTMYFNKRHGRTGGLFGGTFKATHANEDQYLKYLISYIHLNPIKLIQPMWKEAGIQDSTRAAAYLRMYPYSSYSDYLHIERPEILIINMHSLPDYFETLHDFESTTTEWLNYKPI